MELCFEAAQCVACLATLTDRDKWNTARDRFWQLYYGVLAIVEGHDVEACMVRAGEILHDAGEAPALPLGQLCGPSLDLSRKIRALLINAWDIQSIDAKLTGTVTIFGDVNRTFWDEFNKQMTRNPRGS